MPKIQTNAIYLYFFTQNKIKNEGNRTLEIDNNIHKCRIGLTIGDLKNEFRTHIFKYQDLGKKQDCVFLVLITHK